MLSEALFLVAYLMLLPIAVMCPFAGALAYEWLQYMPPYAVYNTYGLPGYFSMLMAALALGLWLTKEKKIAPAPPTLLAIFILYFVWVNITQLTSMVGANGLVEWDRAFKELAFTIALAFMARSRARIEAFIWVICLALGNFVVSGAVKTVLSGGGGFTVVGATSSYLSDRVSFAITIMAIIPLIRFLRNHADLVHLTRRMRLVLDGLTACCLLAMIGTQARTGLICGGVLGVFYFFKSNKKLPFIVAMPFLIGLLVLVAPPQWFNRMNTISTYSQDGSAMGRIDSWRWGWEFALKHPIFGGGFHSYVMHHFPFPNSPTFLEAHNILFETLADHGFVGLGLFLLLMMGTYFNCSTIRRRSRGIAELQWAAMLATMLQLSLLTFLAGSMFLSSATQSMPYELVALSLALRGVVERTRVPAKAPVAFFPEPSVKRRPAAEPLLGVPRPGMAYARQP